MWFKCNKANKVTTVIWYYFGLYNIDYTTAQWSSAFTITINIKQIQKYQLQASMEIWVQRMYLCEVLRETRVCLLLLNHQPRRNAIFLAIGFHEGTLKWKSHEMTKANTIQASRKFRNRCPCQQFWVSAGCTGAGATAATASFDSFHCSNSASFTPATLRATDPQISQVLQLHTGKKIIIKLQRNRLYRSYSKKNQAKQCNVLFQKMMVLVDQSEPNKSVNIYIFWKQVVGYNTNQFNESPDTRDDPKILICYICFSGKSFSEQLLNLGTMYQMFHSYDHSYDVQIFHNMVNPHPYTSTALFS